MSVDVHGHERLPWWHLHLPTLLGSVVMATVTVVVGTDAVRTGSILAWLATVALAVNAAALLAASRERVMGREYEGTPRRFARVAELGPHGRREWWWSVVAFGAFVVAMVATLLG